LVPSTGNAVALTIFFGTDYDTPDCTCIRDYVHVWRSGRRPCVGLKLALEDKGKPAWFNLGTGTGFSVREVVEHSPRGDNRAVPYDEGGPGDRVIAPSWYQGSGRCRDWNWGGCPKRSTLPQMDRRRHGDGTKTGRL